MEYNTKIVQFVFICFYLFCCSRFLTSGEVQNDGEIKLPLSVEKRWENMEKSLENFTKMGIKTVLPILLEAMEKINISSSCLKDTLKLVAGIRKMKAWAFQIVGPYSAIFSGLTTDTISSIGAYDLCINAEAINENHAKNGEVMFHGKYCAVDISLPLPPKKLFSKASEVPVELKNFSTRGTVLSEFAKVANSLHRASYRAGICVPSGCLKSDMDQLAKAASEYSSLSINVNRCEMKEENKFTPLIASIIAVYCFMVFIVIVGTFVDHYYANLKRFDGFALRKLQLFSGIRSLNKLLDTSISSDNLSCLHGIRFFSLIWIMWAHTYINASPLLIRGVREFRVNVRQQLIYQFVIHGILAVDTFFFLSGMLVCYVVIKFRKESNKPFNFKHYIFHRIWRILPMELLVIAFVFLFDLLGSGPVWHDTTDLVVQSCYENWWQNALFVNNLFTTGSTNDVCLGHLWYLACDTQLYMFALVILLPLTRWPKVGLGLAFGTIFASMGLTGAIILLKNYPPTFLVVFSDLWDARSYQLEINAKPYVHAGPYCIGILTGYLFLIKPKLKIPKAIQMVGWCLCFIFAATAITGSRKWNRGENPTVWESFLFASCFRVTWTLGVAWVVICCCTGHGGIANKILSWKALIPFGRLTYLAYLIHPLILLIMAGTLKTEITFTNSHVAFEFFGFFVATFGISFIVNIIVESPLRAMEKVFIPPKKDNLNDFTMQNINRNMENTKDDKDNNLSPEVDTSFVAKGSVNNGFQSSCA